MSYLTQDDIKSAIGVKIPTVAETLANRPEVCEFSPVDNPHPPMRWNGWSCDGYGYLFDETLAVALRKCPCWRDAQSKNLVAIYRDQIPSEQRSIIDNANPAVGAAAVVNQRWTPRKSMGLALTGPCGVGKTVAGHLAMKQMVRDHEVGGVYISTRSIAAAVWAMATDEGDRGRAEKYLTKLAKVCRWKACVFIDDLGRERMSDAVTSKIAEYIDSLYERRAPVVITTNYHTEKLSMLYGPDIVSRLKDRSWITSIAVGGADMREGVNHE